MKLVRFICPCCGYTPGALISRAVAWHFCPANLTSRGMRRVTWLQPVNPQPEGDTAE